MTVTSHMSSPHEGDSRFARAQAKEESSPAHSRPRFPAVSAGPLCRLVVHEGRRLVVLRPEEVEWIEGAGNYVRIHARGEVHLHRQTLAALAARLDPRSFARVHRSAIVRLDAISEIERELSGGRALELRSGVRVAVSRRYFRELSRLLETA